MYFRVDKDTESKQVKDHMAKHGVNALIVKKPLKNGATISPSGLVYILRSWHFLSVHSIEYRLKGE